MSARLPRVSRFCSGKPIIREKGMKDKKGLSLIEILVALIVVGIIAASVSAAVIGGYMMLKQAEHKSRAMSIAHVKLQEFLSKGYSNLTPGYYNGTEDDISTIFKDTADNTYFKWEVTVTQDKMPGAIKVPYKNIEVCSQYFEKNTKGQVVDSKVVRLINVVPYPLIHVAAAQAKFFGVNQKKHKAPTAAGKYASGWSDAMYKWGNITSPANHVLGFNYPVGKDLVLMYNLAITYDTDNSPAPGDTVFTRCLLDGTHPHGIITRTPIQSQIFINNIVEIPNVPAGNHTISLEWSKENSTEVYLREYDISILAVEHR